MSFDNFTAQVFGFFISETLKNVAKGSANLIYNNFNSLFYSEITALGLDTSSEAEDIISKLEANPEILEAVQQKLNTHLEIVKELSKVLNEQAEKNSRLITANTYFEKPETINQYGLSYKDVKELVEEIIKERDISRTAEKMQQFEKPRKSEESSSNPLPTDQQILGKTFEKHIQSVENHLSRSYEFDIALSFAGENRQYVSEVANELKRLGVRVFYDKFETANLWGKDLYTHLQDIYQNKANYTIIFVSEHYAKKLWTNHEKKMAQARAFTESREYILPAQFDDTEIEGIPKTTGYIDLRQYSPQEFCAIVCEKLEFNPIIQTFDTNQANQTLITDGKVSFSVESVTLNYLTKKMEFRGKLKNETENPPARVWLWGYFFSPKSEVEGSWSDLPIEIQTPFNDSNEKDILAKHHFHWWDNSFSPKSDWFARVSISSESEAAAQVDSPKRDKNINNAEIVKVIG